MGAVVRARVALLVVDMALLKVLLVGRAQVFVVDAPAPVFRKREQPCQESGESALEAHRTQSTHGRDEEDWLTLCR